MWRGTSRLMAGSRFIASLLLSLVLVSGLHSASLSPTPTPHSQAQVASLARSSHIGVAPPSAFALRHARGEALRFGAPRYVYDLGFRNALGRLKDESSPSGVGLVSAIPYLVWSEPSPPSTPTAVAAEEARTSRSSDLERSRGRLTSRPMRPIRIGD